MSALFLSIMLTKKAMKHAINFLVILHMGKSQAYSTGNSNLSRYQLLLWQFYLRNAIIRESRKTIEKQSSQ